MKRRLFLTGLMGCGKSTAIANALGAGIGRCGGFLTKRVRDANGNITGFSLESLDGERRKIFLDFSGESPTIKPEVFEKLGVELLSGKVLVLDEIGGVEVLCPGFSQRLEEVLQSDVPILGVLKGEGPAGALIEALGLSARYQSAMAQLRRRIGSDPDTLLYECGKFDENALILAQNWVKEYCP